MESRNIFNASIDGTVATCSDCEVAVSRMLLSFCPMGSGGSVTVISLFDGALKNWYGVGVKAALN